MTHRVLIADDEPNILISLEFLMKREGHRVTVACRSCDREALLEVGLCFSVPAHMRTDLTHDP